MIHLNADTRDIIPPSADRADEAIFGSVDSALRFAFSNHLRATPDSLAQHQKRTRRSAEIFESREERAAMAGVIRRRIGTLQSSHIAIVTVRYAPKATPCSCRRPCCSGWARNPEWMEAAGEIIERSVSAVPGTVSPRRLREGVVKRWSGAERVHIGLLADQCHVHRNTAGAHAKAIRKWLDALFRAASDAADLALR